MSTIRLPVQESIRDLLKDLLGRGVSVDKAGPPAQLDDGSFGMVGCFEDGAGDLRAVLYADRALVCSLGAALTMLPRSAVGDAEIAGEVPEAVGENFVEVVNILGGLLNSNSSLHVRLTDVFRDAGGVPDPARLPLEQPATRSLVQKAATRKSFTVFVEGYGSGLLSIAATDR